MVCEIILQNSKKLNNNLIVAIVALPPPITGQSLATSLICNSINKQSNLKIINLSKGSYRAGINSLSRIFDVFKIFLKLTMIVRRSEICYFTISESYAGNLKDLIIYLILFIRLKRMVVHLHGGAGMRVLMSDKHPILQVVNAFFLKRVGAVVVLGNALNAFMPMLCPRSAST